MAYYLPLILYHCFMGMKTMLIKRSKLELLVFVIADIILILAYPAVYSGAYSLGGSTYDLIQLVLKHIH